MRRSISVVAVLGLLLSGAIMAAAPVAEAKIVVGQGIAGVKLGDTQAQVKRLIGKPSSCSPCGKPEVLWHYEKGFEGVVAFDSSGRVKSMWTASNQQKTSKGIHTIGLSGKGHGSSVAEIKQAYPNAKCQELPNSQGYTTCDLISYYHGRKVETNFEVITASSGLAEISIALE
jgi:hypothetical protein